MELIKSYNVLTQADIGTIPNIDVKLGRKNIFARGKFYGDVTLLMNLIVMATKHPILNRVIDKHLELYPEEINKVNSKNWNSLM